MTFYEVKNENNNQDREIYEQRKSVLRKGAWL